MIGQQIRTERAKARITADLLSARAGVERTRLSRIERGLIEPKPEEAARLTETLKALVGAREKMAAVAAKVGWPM